MTDGPTLYAALMEKALPKDTEDQIKDILDVATGRLTMGVRRALELVAEASDPKLSCEEGR